MFEKIKSAIKGSVVLQFVLVFVAGLAIGALMYPTKHIEETLTQKHEAETKTLKEEHAKETAKLKETVDKITAESTQYRKDTETKITTLTSQVHELKSKQKTAYYKVVRPDGTVEIKKFTESEVNESTKVITQIQQEFKEKVEAIETKWETLHKERVAEIKKDFDSKEQIYKKEIDELKTTKVVDINKKSFGVEAGVLLDKSYYGHVTYDVFGPFFLGLHSQFGTTNTAGAGIGLRL